MNACCSVVGDVVRVGMAPELLDLMLDCRSVGAGGRRDLHGQSEIASRQHLRQVASRWRHRGVDGHFPKTSEA